MKNKPIFFLLLLSAIEGCVAAIQSGITPSESGSSVLGGLSFERLVLISGLTLLSFFFLGLAYRVGKSSKISERCENLLSNPWINLPFVLVALISWILVFTPASGWGHFGGYKERVTPAVVWLLLLSIQVLVLYIFKRIKKANNLSLRNILKSEKSLLIKWAIVLGILAALIIFISVSKIGLIPDIVYWNDFNIPILGVQIIAGLTGSFLILILLHKSGFFYTRQNFKFQKILPDLVICLLLWGSAVAIWTQIEMPKSFFAPGPYPPNNEMYPFSDAVGYDREAMNAVIGEGLGSKTYVDKPVYVAFLSIIHLLVGNRMSTVVGAQIAAIALVPAILYMLGHRIHSRLAGLLTAVLYIFREMNNIQGTLWVLSTNSRLLMSESLAGLFLVLFVLFFVRWVTNRQSMHFLIAAGGSLGLASMIRLNPLLVMPVAVVGIFLLCWKQWKKGVVNALLFIAMFLGTMMPWMIQSYQRSGKILFFMSTMHGVVLEQRTYYALNKPDTPSVIETPEAGEAIPSLSTPSPIANGSSNRTWNRITGISRYVSGHFFHNLIDGAALFPTQIMLNSLEETIKAPNSYWDPDWHGGLSLEQSLLLCGTMITLALGVSAGWARVGVPGLVPAVFFVAYSIATAAVRTSGGRYIIPADWVCILYFAFGLTQLIYWIRKWYGATSLNPILDSQKVDEPGLVHRKWIVAIVLTFLICGSLPVILNNFVPQRYQSINKSNLVSELSSRMDLNKLGLSENQLNDFLLLPDSVVSYGMGLYPRFYAQGKGEPDQFSAFRVQNFPRLVMDVIGPSTPVTGILPIQKSPESLPNGSDVLAIGCKDKYNNDWLALIVDNVVYLRSPETEWTCPVRLPECNDNRVCR